RPLIENRATAPTGPAVGETTVAKTRCVAAESACLDGQRAIIVNPPAISAAAAQATTTAVAGGVSLDGAAGQGQRALVVHASTILAVASVLAGRIRRVGSVRSTSFADCHRGDVHNGVVCNLKYSAHMVTTD